jgi:hypothetical protein
MKFKIEVDIDYIDNEGNLDEIMKDSITSAVYDKIKTKDIEEKLQKKIDNELSDKTCAFLEEKVSKTYDDFIKKEIVLTDRYGNVTQNCTIHSLIEKRFDEFLHESVDEHGNKSSYNGTMPRIDFLINFQIRKHSESFVKNTIDTLEKNLKSYFGEAMKAQISDVILKNTGLQKMIEDSKIK